MPGVARAHDPQTQVAPTGTLLTITAVGRVARTPDVVVFSAGVTSRGKTAAEALAANSVDMNKVVAALKRAGIADKDIQTSNLSLSPMYAPQRAMPDGQLVPAQPQIIGYSVTNQVTVRQRKVDQFGKVLDTLVAAGANQISDPSFDIDKPDAATDEARVIAVKKARARADLYGQAAGLKVVRIVSITESGGYSPQPYMVNARMAATDMASEPTPVAAGEVSVSVSVTVVFELAP